MTAIYARQSVDKKDSLSIEGQVELCKKECSEDFKVYIDKGFSGKTTLRPAFKNLLSDIQSGLVKKVIVYRLDRFSRSISDFGQLWLFLQSHQVEFVSLSEKFDTSTPVGRAMLHIIMVFAQLERETIAQRIRDNYYQRAKTGAWTGGPPPYGFSLSKSLSAEYKTISKLVPTKDLVWVQKIFEFYGMKEYSLGEISKHLNRNNISGICKKTWDNVAVSRILHNPVYAIADHDMFDYYLSKGVKIQNNPKDFNGEHAAFLLGKRDKNLHQYNSFVNTRLFLSAHQGIIPSNLFIACQERLNKNTQLKNTGRGKNSWLSGLLKCGACGYGIKIQHTAGKYYLICSGKSNYHVCTAKYTHSIKEIEEKIAKQIKKELCLCKKSVNLNTDICPNPKMAEIEEKISRLVRSLSESDDVSIDYINAEISRLKSQKEEALHHPMLKPPPLFDFSFDGLSFDEKKMLINQLIEKININPDRIEIVWKI